MARSQWTDAGASQTSAGQARRGAVVALSFSLAMAFGLAACTTPVHAPTQSTISTPRPSVSARPTPSSSPTWLPVRPDSTKSEGLDGAIATARFFLSLYPYVYQTGDLSEWNAMSLPSCEFCRSVADTVTKMVARGEHLEGGDVTIEGAPNLVNDQVGGLVDVAITARQAATTTVSEDGTRTPRTEAGAPDVLHIIVTRSEPHWLVRGVRIEEAAK